MQKIISKIKKIKTLSEDVKQFYFEVPKNFSFKAGQYVLIAIKIKNQIISRAYSIASSPEDKGEIELCVKKVKRGGFAKELFKLKKGSEVLIMGPFGKFFIDKKPSNPIVFISTGTGIVPFKSMIEYLLKNLKFKKQIILIHGYRFKENILYKEFFRELEKEFPNFKQEIILSKPEEKYELKGHVQNFIKKIVKEPKSYNYYICGLKDMISDVLDKLKEIGIKKENIFLEKYN